ncbi:MAG: NADH-quinone oxidoreductase subunit NuoK [Planctomycetes bacterium]|nr:NADH-quinone oxidoreductase subunit NuoK [Planctomycetota bacterium]
MYDIGLNHYLIVSAFVFCTGLMVMTLKRNAIGILIGAELVLNSANINFVACGRYRAGGLDGQIAAVFVIVLAAAEAAIALAIFLNFYNTHATIDVDRGDQLKG